MKKSQIIFLFIGLLLMTILSLQSLKNITTPIKNDTNNESGIKTAAQTTAFYTNTIHTNIPRSFKIDESANLQVILDRDCRLIGTDPSQASDQGCPTSISKGEFIDLIASAFDIAPQQRSVVDHQLEPSHIFFWNITPKHAGRFEIAIDLRGVLFHEAKDRVNLTTDLAIDGSTQPFPKDGILHTSIVINNAFGIDARLADVVSWLIGILAAILAYPIVQDAINRHISKQKNTSTP
jgi:hypothetical protein